MKEKDTKKLSDNSSQTKTPSPIVIKIEAPKEAIKKKLQQQVKDEVKKATTIEDHLQKPTATNNSSKCRQFIPILVFLVTFAAVLAALIVYLDPSSKCIFSFNIKKV